MIERFVDPYTKQTLNKDPKGNLYCSQGEGNSLYKCHDGCYDFVVADLETQQERDYYDKKYSKQQIEMHGFKELVFSRESFLFRIVHRHYGKQFNWGPKAMRRAKPLFQLLKWMDRRLAKKQFMKKNGLMLVWGFKK